MPYLDIALFAVDLTFIGDDDAAALDDRATTVGDFPLTCGGPLDLRSADDGGWISGGSSSPSMATFRACAKNSLAGRLEMFSK